MTRAAAEPLRGCDRRRGWVSQGLGAVLGLLVSTIALGAGAPARRASAGSGSERAKTAPPSWADSLPGSCNGATADVAVQTLHPGEVLHRADLPRLRGLVPKPFLQHPELFFPETMAIEVGPCHRDYRPPAFFRDATERFAGRAKVRADGALVQHVAGLPFPPDPDSLKVPDAGLRLAWNADRHYQGAGLYARRFRYTNLMGHGKNSEATATQEGRLFIVQVGYRADRKADGYRLPLPNADGLAWVAGVDFSEGSARGYRSLQFHYEEPGRSDALYRYSPVFRKVQRLPSSSFEGAGFHFEGGFAMWGLEPAKYRWRVLGTREVLAPVDLRHPVFPADPDRNFGPSGLSIAQDRWEQRRVVVLEARPRDGKPLPGGDRPVARVLRFIDLQTWNELYYVALDAENRPSLLVMHAFRWSEDRAKPPTWHDDASRPVRTLDPVLSFYVQLAPYSAIRYEAWDVTSAPPRDSRLRRETSLGWLHGH